MHDGEMRFFAMMLVLVLPALVMAQEMGQGEARITARSDVRMEIATAPGTPRAELETLGAAVGLKLGAVRACYAERTEEDPTVQGTLVVRVTGQRNGRAGVSVQRDELGDAPLRTCTLNAIQGGSTSGARATSAIHVTFTFTNTAATGHERMQDRRTQAAAVRLESEPDGRLAARGGVESGEVRYKVIGPEALRAQIPAIHGAVRTAIPGLLDCRRRASRRESPAGEVRVDVTVGANGRGRAGRAQSTVADPKSGRCVQTVLSRAQYAREARGRYTVVVEYAPLTAGSGAVD